LIDIDCGVIGAFPGQAPYRESGKRLMADGESDRQRTVEVHGTLQVEPADVEARLKKLEAKVEGGAGKGALAWILDILKTLLPSIVLALVGFALKDTVDQALRERQIQLEAVKEMEKLAPDLQKNDLVRIDAQAKAAQLAAFGRYSVPFFVNILEVGNQNAALGAEDGLRMVARSEPKSVCSSLQAVIRSRSGLYHWQTHLAALKVLGQAGCTEAESDVAAYRDGMASVDNFGKWVADPAPEQTEYDKVFQQAAATFEKLARVMQSQPYK
jgi:hypothetical protein